MKVSRVMTPTVHIADPEDSLQDVARKMAEQDIGFMPVAVNDRLIGMVTDRDIAVRGVASGLSCSAPIEEVMTADVKYCFEDDDLRDVIRNMADIKVRRLPVLDRDKRLVGVLSIGDLAMEGPHRAVGEALGEIAQPGGVHSQAPVY